VYFSSGRAVERRAARETVPYHEVKQGESLASVADLYGFFWDTLWNHPNNARLRESRQNPNVLMARDRVFIPEKTPKEEAGDTGKVHTFQLKGVPVRLNFRLLDEEDQPRAGLRYTLSLDGRQVAAGVTPDDGLISALISPKAKTAELVLRAPDGDETHTFDVGHLKPVEYTSGVQARLKNLGLYQGDPTGQIDQATERAIRMFQQLEGLQVTGQPDEGTKQALRQRHQV
jgi:N-acetylmuramoyl-L-alanine amidase